MGASTPECLTPAGGQPSKDRLAIASVIIVLLILVFMMIDGSIVNYRCRFTEFITFQCNRWDASWKPWD